MADDLVTALLPGLARSSKAGFNVFDVESEARVLEIAARISAVPGPGGVPTQQPVEVRQVMSDSQGEL